eukprot:TRINITY_DN8111_c0_g1_i1.p1 TRINITY_DN8111_c0_g1~~TRINITY_DN8111_c0_g1_i1.p1  ORF type:complete len:292 (+),score=65.57 TRINITY_DN8111_c0_g1_i1:89-964(+)
MLERIKGFFRSASNFALAAGLIILVLHLQCATLALRCREWIAPTYMFALLYPLTSTYILWRISPWMPAIVWVAALYYFFYIMKGPGLSRLYASSRSYFVFVLASELLFDMSGYFIDCNRGARLSIVFGFLIMKSGSLPYYLTMIVMLCQVFVCYFFGDYLITQWFLLFIQLQVMGSDLLSAHAMQPVRYLPPQDLAAALDNSDFITYIRKCFDALSSTARLHLARELYTEVQRLANQLADLNPSEQKSHASSHEESSRQPQEAENKPSQTDSKSTSAQNASQKAHKQRAKK